ncbi:MAG: hypothetical protein AAGI46_04295 [Planctomycetota bacterium]
MRYVVLHHTAPPSHGGPHFDLMLDSDGKSPLWTWRVYDWPPRATTRIERLPDHRRRYLNYEGPISDGRGDVRRVESGVAVLAIDHIHLTTDDQQQRTVKLGEQSERPKL